MACLKVTVLISLCCFFGGFGCGSGDESTRESSTSQCPAGEVFEDNSCRKVCNQDSDCSSDFLRCESSVCVIIKCSENPCASGVSCTDTNTGFQCGDCPAGFTGNGRTCTDIDECSAATSPCSANADCSNTEGSYECNCKAGFYGDGVTCTQLTECVPGQYQTTAPTPSSDRACEDCANGSYSSEANASECELWTVCESGYVESTPGTPQTDTVCEDINECSTGALSCAENASCINLPGSAKCECNSEYYGNGTDQCTPTTQCGDNQFVITSPTPTSDRSCGDCPAGSYSDVANAVACTTDCTENANCGADSYGCNTARGKCVAVGLGVTDESELPGGVASDDWPIGCVNESGDVKFNIDCTFTNEEGEPEVGRCFYKTDDIVECRRTCDPGDGARCTTDGTVCQRSAAHTIPKNASSHGVDWIEFDLYQGQCVPPCTSVNHCNGSSYGCDTTSGLCIWPQKAPCEGQVTGDSCFISENGINSGGVCAMTVVLPYFPEDYAEAQTDGVFCVKSCGDNDQYAEQGDDAVCGGIRAVCTGAPQSGEHAAVYNICAPKCSSTGATYPAILALLGGVLFWRRLRRMKTSG